MGRAPCCDKANVKKGPWSPEEDAHLKDYIQKHGTGGNWIALPQKAGLKRCGKSCRLRWLNYLRPDIKHGQFSDHEDKIICSLFASIGSRWSVIASQLPGRTDNDIKNYWNTKLKKKMMSAMYPSSAHHHHHNQVNLYHSTPSSSSSSASSPLSFTENTNNSCYCPAPYNTSSFSSGSHQHQSISFSPNGSLYEPQENLMVGPIELVAASCSSSNVSHNSSSKLMSSQLVNEAKSTGFGEDQGNMVEQTIAVDNNNNNNYDDYYVHNIGMGMEETQKVMVCDGDYVNGLWEQNTPLDYGLEEIKQLMSSSNSCSNFLFDESLTHKKALYYY